MSNREHEQAKGELLVYQGKDGGMKLEVRLQNETIWLTSIRWQRFSE